MQRQILALALMQRAIGHDVVLSAGQRRQPPRGASQARGRGATGACASGVVAGAGHQLLGVELAAELFAHRVDREVHEVRRGGIADLLDRPVEVALVLCRETLAASS
jgi:hypothetical protein